MISVIFKFFSFFSFFSKSPNKSTWISLGLIGCLLFAIFIQFNNNRKLEFELQLCQLQQQNSQTIQQLNNSIAESNRIHLQKAIESQNSFLENLSTASNQQGELILFRIDGYLKENQEKLYNMNEVISELHIQSCQDLARTLVTFPKENFK